VRVCVCAYGCTVLAEFGEGITVGSFQHHDRRAGRPLKRCCARCVRACVRACVSTTDMLATFSSKLGQCTGENN
jgi:hypothetical protein